MKFDQLQYFVEVAKHEHLGRAAKFLKISPSAISHAISNLEMELEQNLFEKKGKRIFLTSAGKILYQRGQDLLREAENIQTELRGENQELRGYFRLAASHLLSAKLLVPAWNQLLSKNSNLRGEILSLRSAEIMTNILKGEIDLGICFSPQTHPELEMKNLQTGTLKIVVRKNHPLTKLRATKWVEKINDYPAVMPKAFQGIDVCETHPVFSKFNIQPKANFIFDSYEVATSQLLISNHWGFFPDWILEKNSGVCALPLPLKWNAPYHISAVWLRRRSLPRVIEKLLDIILKAID